MKLFKQNAELFIPSQISESEALLRTTDLCIGAHQDDIEIMAYAPISQCFGSKERHFTGVTCTDGAGSPRAGIYADYTNEEMMAVRVQEQRFAAQIGDYSAQFQLDFKSSEMKDAASRVVIEQLKEILTVTKPQTIYTHSLADKHDTHVSVALRVIAAVRELPKNERPKKLYGFEVWRDLDWLCDSEKVLFDTSARPALAAALVGVYDSQVSGGKRYDLAAAGRRICNATYLESHSTDEYESLSFALDMTALIEDDSISPNDFIQKHIEAFCNDVKDRLGRLSN